MNIPQQLKNPAFRFIPLARNSKIPIEKEWQKNNYNFDEVNCRNNVGIVFGYANLFAIDIDSKEFLNELNENLILPRTFTTRTALKQLPHFYFISDEPMENCILFHKGQHAGELRAKNQFCVIPESKIDGKQYEVWADLPIAQINKAEFMKKIEPYIQKKEKTINPQIRDESRSGLEYRKVITLIRQGYDKEQIFKQMSAYSKWKEQGDAYREFTFNKAKTFVDAEPKQKLKIVWDKDLKNLQFQKIEYIVDDLIPQKAICFLGGKRATFKTFVSLNLAYAIASGKMFLDKFATKKVRILYLDEENGLTLIKERAEMIKKGMGIKDEEIDIAFISFANLKLDSLGQTILLENAIEEFKPNLIIVDSFRRFVTFDENEAGQVSKLFTDTIRPLTEDYNLTWILLHHMRKGISGKNVSDEMDEMRGSSDLPNYADVVLALTRNRGSNDSLIFKQIKNRFRQEMSAKVIKLDWADGLKMECLGDAEESMYAEQICGKMILDWMMSNELVNFETKDVLSAMKGQKQSKATIDRALKLLLETGKLIKAGKGKYELCPDASMTQMTLEAKETKNNDESNDSYFIGKSQSSQTFANKSGMNHDSDDSSTIYSESSDSSLPVKTEKVE